MLGLLPFFVNVHTSGLWHLARSCVGVLSPVDNTPYALFLVSSPPPQSHRLKTALAVFDFNLLSHAKLILATEAVYSH